jgi:hypothetical protein
VNQDWAKAIAELKDFGDADDPRQHLEAKLKFSAMAQ